MTLSERISKRRTFCRNCGAELTEADRPRFGLLADAHWIRGTGWVCRPQPKARWLDRAVGKDLTGAVYSA